MSLAIKVRIGGESGSTVWDATDQVPIFDADSQPLVDAGHMYGGDGNASQFQFEVDDPVGEIPRADRTKNLASHNVVTVIEDAPGFDCWIGRGRIADKGVSRGGDYRDDHRYFVATVDDGNTDFRGLALVADWVRPAELGRARVLAALAAFCDGDPRLTTVIANHLVAAGDEVTMPAHTYPANTDLPEIFRDCATTEGKLWGAVIHHAGGSHLCMLYILESDHTTFASGLSITDDDPDLATEFPPIWDQGDATLEAGGDNPVSHVVSRWGADDQVVVAEQLEIIESYDYWAVPFYDSAAETQAQAQTRADAMAASRRTEHVTHQVSIQITAEQVDQVAGGMSIDIKSAASMGGEHLGTNQTRRIGQCKFEKISPTVAGVEGYYLAHLQLNRPQKRMPERVGDKALTTALHLCHDGGPCGDPIDEPAGKTWQTSSNGTHTISNVYAMVAANDDIAAANWMDLTEWDGDPLDFRAKVSTTHDGIHADDQGAAIIIGQSTVIAAQGPSYVADKTFKWQVTRDSAGDVRVSVYATNDLFADQSVDLFNIEQDEPFWIRCNLTATDISMKAWRDDEAEPASWQATASGPGGDLLAIMADNNVFAQTKLFNEEVQFKLFSLDFTSGYRCPSCIHGGPAAVSSDDTEAAPAGHEHDYAASGGTTGQVLVKVSGTDWDTEWADASSGLIVEDDGTPLATEAATLDFVGSGVTVTGAGAEKTVTIPGGAETPWEEVSAGVWRLKTGIVTLNNQDDTVGWLFGSGFAYQTAEDGWQFEANFGAAGGAATAKFYFAGGHGIVAPILSADPAGGDSEDGQVYYNDSTDTMRLRANGAWVDLGGGGTPTSFTSIAKFGVD